MAIHGGRLATPSNLPGSVPKVFTTPKPTKDDINVFYKELSEFKGTPAILLLIPSYNQFYILIYETGCLMKPLTELHNSAAMKQHTTKA